MLSWYRGMNSSTSECLYRFSSLESVTWKQAVKAAIKLLFKLLKLMDSQRQREREREGIQKDIIPKNIENRDLEKSGKF